MIVAVSADKDNCDSATSSHFDESRWFALFNTVNEDWVVVENPYADSLGGAGIQSAQMLIERNIDVVITDRMGRNAFRVLFSANIGVYRCTMKRVKEAVDLFLSDKLERVILPAGGARRRQRRRLGRSS